MPEPRRYRKKPVEIEALRFDGSNEDQIIDWIAQEDGPSVWIQTAIDGRPQIVMRTLEGQMAASRGIAGEYYPCRDDIFQDTYEAIS